MATSSVNLDSTRNIGHLDWEIIDPTPDIHALFSAYNEKFFDNKIERVKLEWSTRLKVSAGICYHYREDGFGYTIIRLSVPLLKYHSRKDLVETLLVSQLNALLFIGQVYVHFIIYLA